MVQTSGEKTKTHRLDVFETLERLGTTYQPQQVQDFWTINRCMESPTFKFILWWLAASFYT